MSDEKKKTRRAKMNMAALWIAVATSLAGTGVPKIVEILSDQPSTGQVQKMIAKSTAELAAQVEALTETVEKLRDRLWDLKDDGARRSMAPAKLPSDESVLPRFNKQTIQQRLQYALPKE